jgi:hypothetical protein
MFKLKGTSSFLLPKTFPLKCSICKFKRQLLTRGKVDRLNTFLQKDNITVNNKLKQVYIGE